MKKMILPMLALVAGIAFSAFTHYKPVAQNATDQPLYWFLVENQSGQIPGAYDGNGEQLKTDEMDITGCQDLVSTHCRYGYTADQLNFDSNGDPVSVKEVSPGVPETPTDKITRTSN